MIDVSRPRDERAFESLALNERMTREDALHRCGLYVVNLATGDIEHSLQIKDVVRELYDVATIPGVIRPMSVGFKTDEIGFIIRREARL